MTAESPKKETARITILPRPAAVTAPAVNPRQTEPLQIYPVAALDFIPRSLSWAIFGLAALIFLIQIWNYVVS